MASDWKTRAKPAGDWKSRAKRSDSTDGELPKDETDSLDALKATTKTGAAMRGIVQGGTLGFGDEAMAAIDTVGEGVGRGLEAIGLKERAQVDADPGFNPTGAKVKKSWDPSSGEQTTQEFLKEQDRIVPESVPEPASLGDTYRKLRDSYRADNKTAQEAHPVVYGAAELASGLAVPVPGSAITKGASLATKAVQAAKTGAKLGAVIGLGNSESDLTKGDVKGAASDVITSAETGAAFGGVGAGVGHGASKLAKYFSRGRLDSAGESFIKGAGGKPGINDQLERMGIAPDQIAREGRELYEKGYVGFGRSKDKVLEAAEQKLGEHIAGKKAALRLAEDTLENGRPQVPAHPPLATNPRELDYERIRHEAIESLGQLSQTERKAAAKAFDALDTATEQARPRMKDGEFIQGDRELAKMYDSINYSTEGALAPELVKAVVRGYRKALHNQIGEASPEALRGVIHHNYGIGQSARVKDMASGAITREAVKGAALPDAVEAIQLAAEMGAGGAALVVAKPLVKSLIKGRGSNAYGVINYKLGKLLETGAGADGLGRVGAILAAQNTPNERAKALQAAYDSDPAVKAELEKWADGAESKPAKFSKLKSRFSPDAGTP